MTLVMTNIFLAWQQSPGGRGCEEHKRLAVGLRDRHGQHSLHWPGYPSLLHMAAKDCSRAKAGALSFSIGILRPAISRESAAFEPFAKFLLTATIRAVALRTPTRPAGNKSGKFFLVSGVIPPTFLNVP